VPLSALRRREGFRRLADGPSGVPGLRARPLGRGCRDGPAVFLIFFLGALAVGMAAWMEIAFSPPIWVHLLILTPVILGGAIGLLRPLKAGMIALQYRNNLLHPPQS